MQYHVTATGYIFHRVRIAGSRKRFSAWFNREGVMLDAEGFDALNRVCDVTPNQAKAITAKCKLYMGVQGG